MQVVFAALFVVTLFGVVILLTKLVSSSAIPNPDKWPPISDDEFIRRCTPGVDRERALKVRRIIAEQLGVDYNRIYPEQSFVEDLGC